MFASMNDWAVYREIHADKLRAAERARLIQAAQQPAPLRPHWLREAGGWLRRTALGMRAAPAAQCPCCCPAAIA